MHQKYASIDAYKSIKRVIIENNNNNKTKLSLCDKIAKLNNSNIKKHFLISTIKIPKSYKPSSLDDDNKEKLNKYVKSLYKRTNENYIPSHLTMLSLLKEESKYLDEMIYSLNESNKFYKDKLFLELKDAIKGHKDLNIGVTRTFIRFYLFFFNLIDLFSLINNLQETYNKNSLIPKKIKESNFLNLMQN